MSLWSRIINVVRRDRLGREIDEELASHIDEATEQGRDPSEARKAFGSALRHRRRQSRYPSNSLARIAPRRRGLRLAPAAEKQSRFRGGNSFTGCRDGRLYIGIPVDRRPVAAAAAGRSAGATLRSLKTRNRSRRRSAGVRWMGLSGLSTDARCRKGSSRTDRRFPTPSAPT